MLHSVRTVGGVVNQTVNYTLDGVGNRSLVAGGLNPGAYTMSPSMPNDSAVNQYTQTPGTARTYDANGNLTHVTGTKAFTAAYDYRNQMMSYTDGSGTQHTYTYDALGRRVSKTVGANTLSPVVTQFFYCGWQVIEEQDASSTTQATYVYGNGIDEVLSMHRGSLDYYYHADDLGNVMKLTNNVGVVSEAYEYGDYGELLDGTGMQPISGSTLSNPYLFTGARFDSETGFYHLRTRYLESGVGRFTTRDTIGIWGDSAGLGNGTTYVGNDPWSSTDPMGTSKGKHKLSEWQKRKLRLAKAYEQLRADFEASRWTNIRGTPSYPVCPGPQGSADQGTLGRTLMIAVATAAVAQGLMSGGNGEVSSSTSTGGLDSLLGTLSVPDYQICYCGGGGGSGGILDSIFGDSHHTGLIDMSPSDAWGVVKGAFGLAYDEHPVVIGGCVFVGAIIGVDEIGAVLGGIAEIGSELLAGSEWAPTISQGIAVVTGVGLAAGGASAAGDGIGPAAGEPTTVANSGSVPDQIISETMEAVASGRDSFTSANTPTADQLLDAGQKFVGDCPEEMGGAGSGVFRSTTGEPFQFRIDDSSLMGNHPPDVPHGHFEIFKDATFRERLVNNHVPFQG
jgi:RHS repeat-associated protein